MNIISEFLIQNTTLVFFVYGLAFYSMGLALLLASRRTSRFQLAVAIRPLGYFAILHGVNEWMDMIQRIAELELGIVLPVGYHLTQLIILVVSFLMLLMFDLVLLSPQSTAYYKIGNSISLMFGFWLATLLFVLIYYQLPIIEILDIGDIFARYLLAIPASLFGAWALYSQRKTMQQHRMPQYGRDLLISAVALLLYGVVGQLFVEKTFLFPSNIINQEIFLQIFGIPVQLFRGGIAVVIAVYMVRALNVFETERQRQLAVAQYEKMQAQRSAIETERRINREKDRLNEDLRLKTRELSILLEVSNLLALPASPHQQSSDILHYIVSELDFPDSGVLMLNEHYAETLSGDTVVGFKGDTTVNGNNIFAVTQSLGKRCIQTGKAICYHADGQSIEFNPQEARDWSSCKNAMAPIVMLGLPLTAPKGIIGALVLAQIGKPGERNLSVNEFSLAVGISQQLGLSIENARLHRQAQQHEKVLVELLNRVVDAQEAERKRIARELHDATGQSLTAIGLGLRGTEVLITENPAQAVAHIQQLRQYGVNALEELRRIIANLRPSQLDDLGLDAALQWYVKQFQEQHDISVRLEIEYTEASLPPDSETTIFRIVQEALTNVAKHANAASAVVRLVEDETQVELIVVDDGVGFSLTQELQDSGQQWRWGLLGIQERAQLLGGSCRIKSSPGHGTRVQIVIPKNFRREQLVDDKITVGG